MPATGLLKYYAAQARAVRANFLYVLHHMDPDGIHDMRVGVKRIRAFFRLLEALQPAFKAKKRYRALRDLFKAAGPLRDAHIMQADARMLEESYRLRLDRYAERLHRREQDARRAFLRFAEHYDIDVLNQLERRVRKALENLPAGEIAPHADAHYHALQDLVRQAATRRGATDDEMHQTRILLKQMRFTGDMLSHCVPGIVSGPPVQARIKELDQTLGQWHDCVVNLAFLAALEDDFADQRRVEGRRYREVIAQVSDDRRRLRALFRSQWRACEALLHT